MATKEASPQRHVLDKNGDTLLILRDDANSYELQVSSSTLSLASKVFRAMFQGYFKEAQDLRTKPELTSLLRFDLPEDDPDGTLFLCSLFHFNHTRFFTKPYNSSLLLKLAIVCDKYQCAQSISVMIPHLFNLDKKVYGDLSIRSCRELVQATYLLDIGSKFEDLTKELILGDSADLLTLGSALPFLGIHAGVIIERREKFKMALLEDVLKDLQRWNGHGFGAFGLRRSCDSASHHKGLMHYFDVFQGFFSCMTAYSMLAQFPLLYNAIFLCSTGPENPTTRITNYAIEAVEIRAHGLCIDCVRNRHHKRLRRCHRPAQNNLALVRKIRDPGIRKLLQQRKT